MRKVAFNSSILLAFVLLFQIRVSAQYDVPADYPTIQQAINAAPSGSTINIAPNTYIEQLEINKDLTLNGSGMGSTIIQSPNSLPISFSTGPTNKAIIYVHDAANVVIQNLTVDGAGKGNSNVRFIGVAFRNAGGKVDNCEIKSVRNTPLDGSQHGVGIYAFDNNGIERTLIISNNSIYDFQKNGTSLNGANLTVHCSGNTVTGAGPLGLGKPAQNGLQISSLAKGSITGNTISNIIYTPATFLSCGILVFQNTGNVLVSENSVSDCQTGIAVQYGNATVSKNQLQNNSANMGSTSYWWMIELEHSTTTVSDNEIDGGGNGIGIEGFAWTGELTTFTATGNKINNCETAVGTTVYGSTGVSNG